MTYRELLTKYKYGEISEEEKLEVERELEKSEAINDFLAEEIEQCIGNHEDRIYDDKGKKGKNGRKEKAIRTAVNRRLATVVGISILSVFIIILLYKFVVSPIVACQYYNPTKQTAGQKYNQDIHYDLRAFTEVSLPGYAISFTDIAENLGFGNYNFNFTRKDLFTKERTTVNMNIRRNLRQGNYNSLNPRDYFSFTEFWDCEEGTGEYVRKLNIIKDFAKEEMDHIKELPSTSYVSAWVRFNEDYDMEELCGVMQTYKNINFKWIAVRTGEKQGRQLIGFCADTNDGLVSGDHVDEEKYPGFQLVDLLHDFSDKPLEFSMAQKYEIHFTSLLKYLVDRHEAVSVLMGYSSNYDYKSALDYVGKEGITTYGGLIYGEPEELMHLYNSGIIAYLQIDNVISSKYIR